MMFILRKNEKGKNMKEGVYDRNNKRRNRKGKGRER